MIASDHPADSLGARRAELDERIAETEEELHKAELGGRRYRVICLRTYLAQLKAERDGGLAHLVFMSIFARPEQRG
ncbi:MAG: hypothetical protein MI723_17435 [Caulobacterales bacterium]|nr:hypothetical protein [Caulobacterales bacterium]